MRVESNSRILKLYGNVKTDNDFHIIKGHVDGVVEEFNEVVVHLMDSISITSAVIGYFTKLVVKDNVRVELYVRDEDLYVLLNDLNLVELLDVKKV